MEKSKTTNKFIALSLAVIFVIIFTSSLFAYSTKASNTEIKSIIEGLQVRQLGSNQVVMTFRGTKMSIPIKIDDKSNALTLEFSNIRFPQNTDKQDWWEDYKWDVIKITKKESNEWWKKYDLPLVQRVNVISSDVNKIRVNVTGEKPLTISKISGMPGSDYISLILETSHDIKPYVPPKVEARKPGDPMSISTPITLELRDVSLREAFRMLAELQKLNLVIDSSVPDSPISFSFKSTSFSEVFAYVLRMNDLSYSLMGKTLIVGKAENINKTLGRDIMKEYVIAYSEIDKLPAMIMGLISLQKPPVVDQRRRTLFVTATPEQHLEIEALINRIDHPGQQVMLQARLIEVNNNAKQEIETLLNSVYKGWLVTYGASGLTAEYTKGNSFLKPNVLTGNNSTTTTGGDGTTSSTSSNVQHNIPVPGSSTTNIPVHLVDNAMKALDVGLTAMESDNKGKVLASPSVVALDGKKAVIKLTHNILYQSGVDNNRNATYSEQETGPTLEITPHIGRDGFITLELKITTGDVISYRKTLTSEMPETTKRELNTDIRVRNGEIFVIGGLYQENKTKGITRVPILSSIPLLGELFKSRTDNHVKSEMAFIVVPYLLDVPTGPAEIFSLPKSRFGD
ncbi:MAG: hypothetical protein RR203_07690 [Synergistaceae bacterium]